MSLNEFMHKQSQRADALDKKLILKNLGEQKVRRMLDTGCGFGDLTVDVAKAVKATEIYGMEIDKSACKKANSYGIKAINHDLNKPFPYKDNYFDLIISIQNIEHLYFTDDYLDEVYRVLRKGGNFVLTTTNLAAIHYRLMLLFGIQPICLHPSKYAVFPVRGYNPRYGHKSVFTFYALKYVLKKHRFKILKSYSHTIYFVPKFISSLMCNFFPNLGTFSCYILKK